MTGTCYHSHHRVDNSRGEEQDEAAGDEERNALLAMPCIQHILARSCGVYLRYQGQKIWSK